MEGRIQEINVSCFLCRRCGKMINRGIIHRINHLHECNGSVTRSLIELEEVFDAKFEIITPKQIGYENTTE